MRLTWQQAHPSQHHWHQQFPQLSIQQSVQSFHHAPVHPELHPKRALHSAPFACVEKGKAFHDRMYLNVRRIKVIRTISLGQGCDVVDYRSP